MCESEWLTTIDILPRKNYGVKHPERTGIYFLNKEFHVHLHSIPQQIPLHKRAAMP